MPEIRRYGTPAWELEVPAGILGRSVDPPADSPYRLDVHPARLAARQRAGDAGRHDPPAEGRRIDGTMDLGEGVSEEGIDRVATIVAAGRRALVLLRIRTRPADEAAGRTSSARSAR
jgi:hypothetical protein